MAPSAKDPDTERRMNLAMCLVTLLVASRVGLLPCCSVFGGAALVQQSRDEGKVAPIPQVVIIPSLIAQLGDGESIAVYGCLGKNPVMYDWAMKLPWRERGVLIPTVGWEKSPLWHALVNWPDSEFEKRLRLKRVVFDGMVTKLVAAGAIRSNACQNSFHRVPASFKVAVAIYHCAHGGTWFTTGFVAGISDSLASMYTKEVCTGIAEVLGPEYMRPPSSKEEALLVQKGFEERRGIAHIGGAVDGTHVPWQPDTELFMEHFHNYKGWYSILVVAVVNSFYMFVDADVGRPGRMSDSTACQLSNFHHQISLDREKWLGPSGVLISDGAFGGADYILSPYPGVNLSAKEQYFNFCFSSTRMYVEQVFGMWKSRWRVCIREQQCSHGMMSLMTYATMILHNICVFHRCTGEFTSDPADIVTFMEKHPLPRCKACQSENVIHCVHNQPPSRVASANPDMLKRRDIIADKLWVNYVQDRIQRGLPVETAFGSHNIANQ